jgi:hypothetical protein
MRGLTDYITQCHWADVFTVWFVIVDDSYQVLYGQQRLRARGPAPAFTDSEVITLSLVCDTYFHGNEELMLSFIRQYHADLFPHLLSNSRFNRRRRASCALLEGIRQALSEQLIDPADDLRLIDSAPIPVCTYMRAGSSATVTGSEYFSVMPTRKAKLFGFRLQLTVTLEQVPDQWMLVPAAPRDSKMALILLSETHDRLVYGDNAYRDPGVSEQLTRKHQVELLAPPRQHYDKHVQWPQPFRLLFNRVRRQIESAFSVLTGVFHLAQPRSRSLAGLMTRTATRLLAYTISFLVSPILLPDAN